MSSFTVLLLCIQACLVQNVFSQVCHVAYASAVAPALAGPCGLAGPGLTARTSQASNVFSCGNSCGSYAPAFAPCGLAGPGLATPYGLSGLAYDGIAYPAAAGYGSASYGGAGEGNVAVAGELPVCGNTAVAGQVPIMGAVNFGGAVPACGAVSICGKCACGCGSPCDYFY